MGSATAHGPPSIRAVVGFRRLSSRSPQNPPRRLDVGLRGPFGESAVFIAATFSATAVATN